MRHTPTHNEDAKYDWHSSQPRGAQFKDYMTRDSAVEVCRPKSIEQALGPAVADQYERRIEEEEEDEVAFLDALTALEVARHYMFQFDI
jgi:hypothetical protein